MLTKTWDGFAILDSGHQGREVRYTHCASMRCFCGNWVGGRPAGGDRGRTKPSSHFKKVGMRRVRARACVFGQRMKEKSVFRESQPSSRQAQQSWADSHPFTGGGGTWKRAVKTGQGFNSLTVIYRVEFVWIFTSSTSTHRRTLHGDMFTWTHMHVLSYMSTCSPILLEYGHVAQTYCKTRLLNSYTSRESVRTHCSWNCSTIIVIS